MSHVDDASVTSLLRSLLRGMLPAIALAVIVASAVYVVSVRFPPVYTTFSTLLASNTNPGLGRFGVALAVPPPIDLVAYRSLAKNQSVLDRARSLMSDPAVFDRAQITATSEVMPRSSIIRLHVRAGNPDGAAEVANNMARALVEWDLERSTSNVVHVVRVLEEQVAAVAREIQSLESAAVPDDDQLESARAVLAERQEQLALARALSVSTLGVLSIVEYALPPDAPVAPLPSSYAAVAFLLVLFVGFGLSMVIQALDVRVRSAAEVSRLTGLPLLAEFRRRGRHRHGDQQAMQFLRANLDLMIAGPEAAVVVFTSPLMPDRRAHLAAASARTFALDGRSTLLVDADASSSALSDVLDVPRVVTGPRQVKVDRDGAAFDVVLGFGARQGDGALVNRVVRAAFDGWRERYDLVVVDAAPVLEAADALVMARSSSGVVLVVDLVRSTRDHVREAVERLQRSGAPFIGLVVIAPGGRGGSIAQPRSVPLGPSGGRRLSGAPTLVRQHPSGGS